MPMVNMKRSLSEESKSLLNGRENLDVGDIRSNSSHRIKIPKALLLAKVRLLLMLLLKIT